MYTKTFSRRKKPLGGFPRTFDAEEHSPDQQELARDLRHGHQ